MRTDLEAVLSAHNVRSDDGEQLVALLDPSTGSRPKLLAWLKEQGVSSLPERQRLASSMSKVFRAHSRPARAEHPPPASSRPTSVSGDEWFQWAAGWQPVACQSASTSCNKAWLDRLIVIDGVLTPDECTRLVARAEEAGFALSEHQGARDEGFRRGRRVLITDGGLAAEIFARITHALPPLDMSSQMLRLPSEHQSSPPPPYPLAPVDDHERTGCNQELASASGVWESLRVLSYDCEDFFLPHRDNACGLGSSSLHPHCRSHCSLLVYLADSEDGSGATRFYREPADAAADKTSNTDDARPNPQIEGCTAVADVVPWAGRAVIFPHKMLHASLEVIRGRKYVVRGDVLWPGQPPQPV